MTNYYSKRMKLLDNEEKRMVRRILIILSITGALLIAIIFGGLPTLLSIGSFFNFLKGEPSPIAQNIPVIAPKLEPLDTATNSATIPVKGISQEGVTVDLFVNDQQTQEVVVGKDGEFSFTSVELKDGLNTLYALAKTQEGKQSPQSSKHQITLDTTLPKVTITSPEDGQSFSNVKEIKVSGKTEPTAIVTVNDSIATVTPEGQFTTILPASSGPVTIKIIVTDTAGNQTTVERKVTLTS